VVFGNRRYDGIEMKILPSPEVPGATPWQRLDNAFRQVLTVPKEALVKEEAKEKAVREKKRAAKKPH
jgi:hypothetical protein